MKKIIISSIVAVIIGTTILITALNWRNHKTDVFNPPASQKNETADWQIYKSFRGFSIKCPADSNGYSDIPNDTTAYQDGLKTGCTLKNNGLANIEIVSWTKFTPEIWGKAMTFEKFIDNEIEIIQKDDPNFQKEEINLNGNPAVKIIHTHYPSGESKIINIYTQKNGRMYQIQAVINPKEAAEYLPIIEKIISTFRLAKKDLSGNFCG